MGGRHPVVYLAVERSLAGHGTTVPPGTGRPVRGSGRAAGPGDGLGALAAPSLPSRWLTCFLTVSRLTTSSWAIRGLGMPAASSARISSSRAVSCSPRRWRRQVRPSRLLAEDPQEPGQTGWRDAARGGLYCLLGRDQSAQQRAHRRTLVGEHSGIALRASEGEHPGQDVHRAGLLAAGSQSQRPQRLGLDDAAGPVLGGRRRVQPLQQGDCLGGAVLGEHHPRQHPDLPLPLICRLVASGEASLLGPAGGCGEATLSQQQPCPLRGARPVLARAAGRGRLIDIHPGRPATHADRRVALGFVRQRAASRFSGPAIPQTSGAFSLARAAR